MNENFQLKGRFHEILPAAPILSALGPPSHWPVRIYDLLTYSVEQLFDTSVSPTKLSLIHFCIPGPSTAPGT